MKKTEVACQNCKYYKKGQSCRLFLDGECTNYNKFEDCNEYEYEVEIHHDNKNETVEVPVEDELLRETVLDEAKRIVNGDRNEQYGEPEDTFAEIAALWEIYLECAISPRDVAMMMILLKVARDNNKHKRDNLVDICGYAACAEKLG